MDLQDGKKGSWERKEAIFRFLGVYIKMEYEFDSKNDMHRFFDPVPSSPEKLWGEIFVNPDGSPLLLEDESDDGDDSDSKLRRYMKQIAAALGFDLKMIENGGKETTSKGPTLSCASLLKSTIPAMRVVGYVGLTTMSVALSEPRSSMWPLLPAFLYIVHMSLKEKSRLAVDAILLMQLASLTLQVLQTTVPSDENLLEACMAQRGDLHCKAALTELEHSTSQLFKQAQDFQSNPSLLDHGSGVSPGDSITAFKDLTLEKVVYRVGDIVLRFTEMSSLASFFFTLAYRRSVWEAVKHEGWISSFFLPHSLNSLIEATKIATVSNLMYTMANMSAHLEGLMKFVVLSAKRGFSETHFKAIMTAAMQKNVLLEKAASLEFDTMSKVISLVLFFFMLLYYVLYAINRRRSK